MGLGIRSGFERVGRQVTRSLPGWDQTNWLRVEQVRIWNAFLDGAAPATVLEISPGDWSPWKSRAGYRSVSYPTFDIVKDRLDERFDVVIADQVLEHVPDPAQALGNIKEMVRPGGVAMIAMPFLFRVHARPHDYYRWTPAGMAALCASAGFEENAVTIGSWGNQACAKAHIGGRVKDFGWNRDLTNDPEYPIMVWAFCRKA